MAKEKVIVPGVEQRDFAVVRSRLAMAAVDTWEATILTSAFKMKEITRTLERIVGRTAATKKDLVLGVGQGDYAVVRAGPAMAALDKWEATMFTCA